MCIEKIKKDRDIKPVVLLIAEQVKEETGSGEYDKDSSTWSNRDYDLVSSKKWNEAM